MRSLDHSANKDQIGILKTKQKRNVLPISSNNLLYNSKRGAADAAASPEKKTRTCRASLAPDCELRVAARSSIKRSAAESRQKITKELFKPISVLLGEKVDIPNSPNNRAELKKKSLAKRGAGIAHTTPAPSKAAAVHKSSALRLSPLPSEILNLPAESCFSLKEETEEG